MAHTSAEQYHKAEMGSSPVTPEFRDMDGILALTSSEKGSSWTQGSLRPRSTLCKQFLVKSGDSRAPADHKSESMV